MASSLWRKWFGCWLFWPFFYHEIRLVQEFDKHRRKLQCIHCKTYFAMSDVERSVMEWDADYERIICDMFNLRRTLL